MRQLSFNLGSGEVGFVDLPFPAAVPMHVTVVAEKSLMSAGTERMLLDFGRGGWMDKIRQQPDKVRDVLEKVRAEGLISTLEAVRAKLDQPIPIGYSHVGRVSEVGKGVAGFAPGDRVVCNGAHAEVVRVPATLCAKIPDAVSDEAASFTVVGAIALQGIRLADPVLGEQFVVIGLGLIGLLTCQILIANGCRVLGCDFDARKLGLARAAGVRTFDLTGGADVVAWVMNETAGRGADGVVIAASTATSDPVRQAAQMSRKRGRIVLVGVAAIDMARSDLYEKELSFQVSCSYGPGRYDPAYEQQGQDYPYGFVRWTAQRNFEAVLQLLESGRVSVESLVTHRFDFNQSPDAYRVLGDDRGALGLVLDYAHARGDAGLRERTVPVAVPVAAPRRKTVGSNPVALAFIGAGNYAMRVLAPHFARAGADLRVLANTGSLQGGVGARRHGFASLTSDVDSVFGDPDVQAVVIATQHDSHATLTMRALHAGKHVLVEKPLSLTLPEVEGIASAQASRPDLQLCVGFNRRFSPVAQRMREAIRRIGSPTSIIYRVNAGKIPTTHWTQSANAGGGRVVGECCHFIDFLRFLTGSAVSGFEIASLRQDNVPRDTATLTLTFADGSMGTIHYFANGPRSLPKERVEVFGAGRHLQMENFHRLSGDGWGPGWSGLYWRADKGQHVMVSRFLQRVREGGPALIPYEELWEVSRLSILAQQAIDAR